MSHCLTKVEAVAALRAAADLIDDLPDSGRYWFVAADAFNLTPAELAAAVRAGGKWEKGVAGVDDAMFQLSQGIVELHADREQVCTAVPTGRTTTVKKVVTAAVTEEVTVPEVEWVCEPLLAKAES